MKKKLLLSLCLGCIAAGSMAQHAGRVFEDKNNNGLFDKGDLPLRGIAVSDGLNVVQTATDGTFSLPGHDKERFVFITTPSGYKTDNKHYRRIEGKNGAYLFGLHPFKGRVAKDGSHTFVHITDTEIFNTQDHGDWVGNIRDYSKNEQAAFIIHTGDICYENGLKSHINLMNTANMDCPMFYCIGNHDLVKGAYGEELFESLYGPVFYSFDMGNVHYIVTPMLGGDHAPSYKISDVYHWMKNDLALVPKGKAVMVFNHDLLTDGDQFIYGKDEKEPILLNEHNLKAWIYGHWHINYMKKQGDVYSICTATLDKGGIDHSTSAFRAMHVDGKGDFTSELRYTYIDKHMQIASLVNGEMPIPPSGVLPLSVNVYSSVSPVKEVIYTFSVNGKAIKKNQKLRQQTDWNWYAGLPLASVKEGDAVTILATALFKNGEKAETERSLTFQSDKQATVRFADDWKNLLGNPQHIGVTRTQLELPLTLAWTKNVGANLYMSSPLVYKGNVYVASVDEDLQGTGVIHALNGANGELLWTYPVRNSIKNTIAIDGGYVYAQDAQGYLYAVDAATGKLAWEKKLSVNGLPALIDGLVADKGIVYAGTGKGLCASNGVTGEALWTNTEWGQGEGTTSTGSLQNNILVNGAQWNALYANDATTGKLLWSESKDGLRNRGASPAFHGNLLYLISEASFFILDATTGKVIVRKPMPFSVDATSTPLLTDKEIIFGSAKDGLVALDNETLETKWNFKTADALVYTSPYSRKVSSTIETSPIQSGNIVFVGASDGTIYGVNKETGKAEWQYSTGAPVFGSVAASGNALVATDFAGNVYVFVSTQ